jgi:hypothetical protein
MFTLQFGTLEQQIHVQQSYNLPLALARHAASLPHRAYVRLVFPYYVMSNSVSGGYTERFAELSDKAKKDKKGGLFRSKDKGSDGLGPKPDDVRGRWWHESVRAQAAVPNLNYCALRVAAVYGESFMDGEVLARLVIGAFAWSFPFCMHSLSGIDLSFLARSAYLQVQE